MFNKVQFSQIHTIGKQGFSYQDSAGQMQMLMFETCFQHYLHQMYMSEFADDSISHRQVKIKTDFIAQMPHKEIGRFYLSASPIPFGDEILYLPFMSFHHHPLLVVTFETSSHYRQMNEAIAKAGYFVYSMFR